MGNLAGASRPASPPSPFSPRLTATEVSVILLIARGLPSREVADLIGCRKRTVDFHLQNIYQKLGVSNRMEAVNVCRRMGVVE